MLYFAFIAYRGIDWVEKPWADYQCSCLGCLKRSNSAVYQTVLPPPVHFRKALSSFRMCLKWLPQGRSNPMAIPFGDASKVVCSGVALLDRFWSCFPFASFFLVAPGVSRSIDHSEDPFAARV